MKLARSVSDCRRIHSSRAGVRFCPPAGGEIEPEMSWLLSRAFGPKNAEIRSYPDIDGDRAAGYAQKHVIASRICARSTFEFVAGEVGRPVATTLSDDYHRTAATVVRYTGLVHQIADLASRLGQQIVVLKGLALHFGHHTPLGCRTFSDVDFLVDESGYAQLFSTLVETGFRPTTACGPLELEGLMHHSGLMVEIHTSLPQMRGNHDRWMDFEFLQSRGLLRRADGLPEAILIPHRGLILAHLVVHALSQHAYRPAVYPPLRLIGDIQDIDQGEDVWREFFSENFPTIAEYVSHDEVTTARDLAAALLSGESPDEIWRRNDVQGRMLRHMVLGVSDRFYQQNLVLGRLLKAQGHRPRVIVALSQVMKRLWPTRHALERKYGPRRTTIGYLCLRLWRPVDVVLMCVSYSVDWSRTVLRRRQTSDEPE